MTTTAESVPYAVVQTGGKQYLLKAGTVFNAELISGDKGAPVEFKAVLAKSDGKTLTIGTPLVAGAKVLATIEDHIRGEKTVSFKKKRRKGYHKKIGHRQELTVLKVTSIA